MHEAPQPDAETPTIKLAAIDLDGTLLQKDQTVLAEDQAAIREAQAEGVKVVLASARPPRSARAFYELLALDTPQVNYNGALVQVPGKTPSHHCALDAGLAHEVFKLARSLEPACVLELEVLDRSMTDKVHPNLRTQTSLRFTHDVVAPAETLFGEPVTKLMLMASTPRVKRLEQAIREEFGDRLSVLVSDRHLIQIAHPDVDKADGVRRVAALYGVEAVEVLAVGDAPNDAGLLAWAGVGVAVGNGWKEAKDTADVVGPGHTDAAVAWALREFVLA